MSEVDLASLVKEFNPSYEVITSIEDAFYTALIRAGRDSVVLVTGSIFVVAAARELWFNNGIPLTF